MTGKYNKAIKERVVFDYENGISSKYGLLQ